MRQQSKLQMLECAYIHTDGVFKLHSPFKVIFQIRQKQQEH